MVLQVLEGKCKTQIDAALHAKHLRIVQDHVLLNPYEPCDFKLEFLDPALDCATAREDWICQWTFTHPKESLLTEEGWEITHYFQKPEIYGLEVVLTHRMTGVSQSIIDPRYKKTPSPQPSHENPNATLPGPAEGALAAAAKPKMEAGKENPAMHIQVCESKVQHWLSSHALDSLNFVLALFIVLVGMIAGANEQLLKLDVVPALIATFLAGVGADQIKNLLTKQSESNIKPKSS
jgi:hypothetical protein